MTRLLQDLLHTAAEARPAAGAVVLGAEALTYGALADVSRRLAAALHAAGCRRGDRVCILEAKSPRTVVSILGVLEAGCVYVPLDVSNPPARLLPMLASTEPSLILCDRAGAGALRRLAQDAGWVPRAVGWMDADPVPEDIEPIACTLAQLPPPGVSVSHDATPRDLAYILFTSGSTGVPKGVTVTHANVLHFVDWATAYFGIAPDDRLSGHSPLHFDLSVFDLFGALAAGAELHLVPPELNLVPHRLADFIRDAALTQWFSVPSLLSLMAGRDVVRAGDFPALERLLWCGEVFPTPALRYWMERLPHVRFTNLYGPTEATIASSYHTLDAPPNESHSEVPIGRACPGEELLVLDENLAPVPPGTAGDLCIRGAGLSPGYWRDPQRTASAFVRHPATGDVLYRTGDVARVGADGLVYFAGRADSQIKSRGYRIELGEIEAALAGLDYLSESAVVAVDSSGFEGKRVCCAYALRPGRHVAPATIRSDLQARLPSYMLPTNWRVLDRLPRNANGKIDRRALVEQFDERAAVVG